MASLRPVVILLIFGVALFVLTCDAEPQHQSKSRQMFPNYKDNDKPKPPPKPPQNKCKPGNMFPDYRPPQNNCKSRQLFPNHYDRPLMAEKRQWEGTSEGGTKSDTRRPSKRQLWTIKEDKKEKKPKGKPKV